jgi:hypothetical protein
MKQDIKLILICYAVAIPVTAGIFWGIGAGLGIF